MGNEVSGSADAVYGSADAVSGSADTGSISLILYLSLCSLN
jgi:hypothetical protein